MKSDVDIRKVYSKYRKEAAAEAKRIICPVCGTEQTSFCCSHTVPQFILRNIAIDGLVLTCNVMAKIPATDMCEGIQRAGAFYLICRKCDSMIFQEYENESTLKSEPTNRMMAEIAMKNALHLLSKRYFEVPLYSILQNKHDNYKNKEVLDEIHQLDIVDYDRSFRIAKNILDKNLKSGYLLTFWAKLPYVVPIAGQAPIIMVRDLEGRIINDTGDTSNKCHMEEMHVCIFPLESESVVFSFHHKDDIKYRAFDRQFQRRSFPEKLAFINHLYIKYSEDLYISPRIRNIVEDNSKLNELSREYNELPNFGRTTLDELLSDYRGVSIEEIPNLLAPEYALS